MCSIFGILNIKNFQEKLRLDALAGSRKQRHRGPDWSGIYADDFAIFVHERLSIVDVESGAQPIISEDGRYILVVNGEIYNHRELERDLKEPYSFQTKSDCEVIIPLISQEGVEGINKLNGIFSFILYDKIEKNFIIARDHMGIIPLYYGNDEHGNFYVSSEMKAISDYCNNISTFTPGHYLKNIEEGLVNWYKPTWSNYSDVKDNSTDKKRLRVALEEAVHRQMMSDVPYGVLLSGGLDSSIISALVKKFAARRVETNDMKEAWWPNIHSFAVGIKGAPDLKAAKIVAEHIGTVHHEINFTVQDGIDALEDVIYHLETYDITTIRASVPMFLMARKIKAMGIKMVLSGEGSDEIFGGYLYFHKAPNPQEFHEETVRKLSKLYLYDCLRANKSMAAWGVEARVPFLDKEFLNIAMSINPNDKMVRNGKIEKHILREMFADYLPESIVWRQKEQFSDGVGYSWIDQLKLYSESHVSDELFANAKYMFPINTPKSKEGYLYRSIFSKLFPKDDSVLTVGFEDSIACSTAKALEWDESFKKTIDPSGRAVQQVHDVGML
ncbi:asparagine synthase B [bacterium]|nr:asparagine synthase B [bacterium]